MSDVVIHPLGISVLRSFLLQHTEITGIVGQRIGTSMETGPVKFPSLRLHEITSNEVIARRFMRMLVQIDCWAERQVEADRLARVVIGVLRDSANYMTPDAVMGESTDLSTRAQADHSLNPPQPRSIISAHIWVRPRP